MEGGRVIQPSLLMPPGPLEVPTTAVRSSAWDALQEKAFETILATAKPGVPTVYAAPTGFGKTKLSFMCVDRMAIPQGWSWIFYTGRRMLFSQTRDRFEENGLVFGYRASGHETSLDHLGQMAMLPTEKSQFGKATRGAHSARLVIVDEAHANNDEFCQQLIKYHVEDGAIVIGMSATPVNLGGTYKQLVPLCSNSELRSVGGLLLADCYTPTTVELGDVKKVSAEGEFNQKALGKRFAIQQVVGQVYESWTKLNPNGLPTLGFAPGVEEGMWFVDQMRKKGVKCAHVDGKGIYLGEKSQAGDRVILPTSDEMREEVRLMSLRGEVHQVWNRFVFREGVDWPHIYHGIFATAFAQESTWVQCCGRILRAFPGYEKVVIQDHGGSCLKPGLGSPNANREWDLKDTNATRSKAAQERLKDGVDKEPMTCPGCCSPIDWGAWKRHGDACPKCGKKFTHSVRWVQQTNGELKRDVGAVTKIKRKHSDAQRAWDAIFWPSLKSSSDRSSTFNQLLGRFHKSNPGMRIQLDQKRNQTVAIHLASGERTVLGNCPAPTSAAWGVRVKNVQRSELQRSEG